MPVKSSYADRFAASILPEPNSGCWLWDAGIDAYGYGRIASGKRPGEKLKAHRLSYELHCGPISHGANVLHRCDVRLCVNPSHLFLGSHQDNHADMVRKRRHCIGARNGRAILSDGAVRAARAAFSDGATVACLALHYGVRHVTMGHAVTGRSWRHVR
jgi:hypothetical protein